MQALFDLVHAMAKEEKRLYHLHGRKGRFIQIYKGYLQAISYSKELDRTLYQKHFGTFSKAFYSMQKNALLDDLLAVLLEYSNSTREDFVVHRLSAKYNVLLHRGFPEQALNYIRSAIDTCGGHCSPRTRLRLLEDLRDALASSESPSWEEYAETLERISAVQEEVSAMAPVELAKQKLKVILASAKAGEEGPDHKAEAWDTVETLQALAASQQTPLALEAAFDGEYLFSKAFEDRFATHKRLVAAERTSHKEGYPRPLRLRIVNLLMENSMDCGDFLLINGLVYKTNKELPTLSSAEKRPFLARYLELCSLYHFYENDLPGAQQELTQLLALPGLDAEMQARHYCAKVAVCIAANLPRAATEALEECTTNLPEMRQDLRIKLMELMVAVELNKKEDALVAVQRLRALLRKAPDARKLAHYRLFLEMLQKMLTRKRIVWQDIPALNTGWAEPLKPNLWLKAKMENKFYYNYILEDWQARKKIMNV